MKAQLLKWWDLLRTGFWFIPSLMAGASIILAVGAIELDKALVEHGLLDREWIYSGSADGASAVLQTIAGSMITIAGVVFSLTLVALSLASSQFGPRLLRNFMRDTPNHLVLGTFIATFLYCLLVLRTIRRADEGDFVPNLAVSLSVLLALSSLWVLIYFIHHISISIQADHVIARVAQELSEGIDRLFPEHIGADGARDTDSLADSGSIPAFGRDRRCICADEDGYLELIDADAVMTLAVQNDLVLWIRRRPGDYVTSGGVLAAVWPRSRCNDDLARKLGSAFALGVQRTPTQDIGFAIHQLVEIAVRALSPGVNDPFTAAACIDRLGSALCRLAGRNMPSPYRFDEQDRLRVIAPAVTYVDLVDAAFDDIRQHAASSAAVLKRLLETIGMVAMTARRPEDRTALRRHADMIGRAARTELFEPEDRQTAEERYRNVLRVLDETEERFP